MKKNIKEIKKNNDDKDLFIVSIGILIIILFMILFLSREKEELMSRYEKSNAINQEHNEEEVYSIAEDANGNVIGIKREYKSGNYFELIRFEKEIENGYKFVKKWSESGSSFELYCSEEKETYLTVIKGNIETIAYIYLVDIPEKEMEDEMVKMTNILEKSVLN